MNASEKAQRSPRQFLIRIRPKPLSTHQPDALHLDLEAQVDGAIFPFSSIKIDLNSLNQLLRKEDNEYGTVLGKLLFDAAPFAAAISLVGESPAIRTQIMLEGDGFHHGIRWERLSFPQWSSAPIAIASTTPFSRFCAVNQPLAPVKDKSVFSLLLIVANSVGLSLPEIKTDEACLSMLASCRELLANGQMRLTVMPGHLGLSQQTTDLLREAGVSIVLDSTTADAIKKQLDATHALHVIAHGSFHKDQFFLMLEDEPCKSEDIVKLLAPAALRLVCFESCQTAVADNTGVAGMLNQLVRAGVPAAVGMQDFITMDDASVFRECFYRTLVQEGSVDEAANSGRRQLDKSAALSWSIPVVATRLADGKLWRESQLRAAVRCLEKAIRDDHKNGYPALPIETVTIARDAIHNRQNLAENDSLDNLQVNDQRREDVLPAISAAIASNDAGPICLIGPPGRSKTRILEDAFLEQCRRYSAGTQSGIPVMLRLADCSDSAYDPAYTICNAIARYFSDRAGVAVEPAEIAAHIAQGQQFLFFVNGDDDLGHATLTGALKTWDDFLASSWTGSRCICTLDQNSLTLADIHPNARCLMVQPMRFERVRTYLDGIDEIGKKVCTVLTRSRVFDLAEIPWVLTEMLNQAKRGVLENNRASILGRVINERLSRHPGFRTRAAEALYELAWEMQVQRVQSLNCRDVFDILDRLRGNRDYNLVEFRDQLVGTGILSPGGEDGLRFSYVGFRIYCAANYLLSRPDAVRIALLEDITATLGRKARADWWVNILAFLAGLWDKTFVLLRLILSGSPLHQGEQIYIAGRCLQEARVAFPGAPSDSALENSIINALIYNSHPMSLRSVASRKKVLSFLGPLIEPAGSVRAGQGSDAAIFHLVSLVLSKIRPDDHGTMQYDFSGIRLAAVNALLYAPSEVALYLEGHSVFSQDPELRVVVNAWINLKPDRLINTLELSDSEPAVTVAAFALALMDIGEAFEALTGRFNADDSSTDLLWALTEAITLVGKERIRGFIEARLNHRSRLIYLLYVIGKTRVIDPQPSDWEVLQNHLHDSDDHIQGRALFALSELGDKSQLQLCYRLLHSDSFQLRYYALQSLRNIGDQSSLETLAQIAWQTDAAGGNSFVFLEQLRLEVYEDIYWRLAGGLSREVMLPIENATIEMVQKRGT